MLNKKSIDSFLDYNFQPFSKIQCVKRLVFIWILNIPFYIIENKSILMKVVLSLITILISVLYIKLLIKQINSKKDRFTCDGVTYSYIAVILNLLSYKVSTFVLGENLLLMHLSLFLLVGIVTLFLIFTYRWIKEDKYSSNKGNRKAFLVPFWGGISGIFISKMFFDDISNNIAIIFLSMCLMFFSFVISIGSINLLKLFFIMKIEDGSLSSGEKD